MSDDVMGYSMMSHFEGYDTHFFRCSEKGMNEWNFQIVLK